MSNNFPNIQSINFDIEQWHQTLMNPMPDILKDNMAKDYVTKIDFIIPSEGYEPLIGQKEIVYKVGIKGNETELPPECLKLDHYDVTIWFEEIKEKSQDIIANYGQHLKSGAPSNSTMSYYHFQFSQIIRVNTLAIKLLLYSLFD